MKRIKHIFVALAAFWLVLSSSLLMQEKVHAAVKEPKLVKLSISTFLSDRGSSFMYYVDIKNLAGNASVTRVRSSNKNVLTVKYNKGTDCIYYFPQKIGKANISCTVKQNGKTYRLKTAIQVKKGNPFKAIKINGKNMYKHKGRENLLNYYSAKKKVRILFRLNSGWKLKRMYYNYHTSGKMSKNYNLKNGGKVKIKGDYTTVKIDVKNKKGDVYRYLICLHYKE